MTTYSAAIEHNRCVAMIMRDANRRGVPVWLRRINVRWIKRCKCTVAFLRHLEHKDTQ